MIKAIYLISYFRLSYTTYGVKLFLNIQYWIYLPKYIPWVDFYDRYVIV